MPVAADGLDFPACAAYDRPRDGRGSTVSLVAPNGRCNPVPVSRMRTPLGRLLQERREALGYSRARTSELTGLRAGTIESWELGRVAKPPVDDVLKLARFLAISPDEVAAAVLERDGARRESAGASASGAVPLLEQAIALFGWSEEQAAAALQTSAARVQAWRAGTLAMTLPEVMSVAALVGLHAAGAAARGGRIADLVATLGQTHAGPDGASAPS